MKKKEPAQNKKDRTKVIWLVIILAILLAITVLLIPSMISLKDASTREALQDYIHQKGAWGVVILLGIQVTQVIIAFIPGEVIEVISGLLYGTFYGYVICTVGMLIGTVIIFYTVRALGFSYINSTLGEKKLSKYKFLHDTKKLELVIFLLFFIPGTPKDLLTYFIPFTKIKPSTFFIINTVARIPSILSSTYAGASISQGKWLQTVIVFAIIGIVGIVGIMLNERFIARLNKRKQKVKDFFHID